MRCDVDEAVYGNGTLSLRPVRTPVTPELRWRKGHNAGTLKQVITARAKTQTVDGYAAIVIPKGAHS